MDDILEFPLSEGAIAPDGVPLDHEHAAEEIRKVVEKIYHGEYGCYVLFLPEQRQTEAGIQMRPLVAALKQPRTAQLVHVALSEEMAQRAVNKYQLENGKPVYRKMGFPDLMRFMLRMMSADVWGCALLREENTLIASTRLMQTVILELQGKDPTSFQRTADMLSALHACRRANKSFYMPVMKVNGKATPVCFGNEDPRVCPVSTSRERLENLFVKMTEKPLPMQVNAAQLIERLAGFERQTGGFVVSFMDGDQTYPSHSAPFCRSFCEIFRVQCPAVFEPKPKQ
ncbi:MAG: hypothetical protein ACI4PQ_01580 [Butyricicoccaceae bacterium]